MERFKSINKAISVLKCFNSQDLALSASEISKKVGIHRVTSHRLLETLFRAGLLEKSAIKGKYSIGSELYVLGSLYLKTMDVIKVATPVVQTINELTGEAVALGILKNDSIIVVLREQSKHALRFDTHVGSVWAAHATSTGKALLSNLSETELDDLYPQEKLTTFTAKTIATKTELKLELEQIRKAGVAYDLESNNEKYVGVASAVRDVNGRAVAALNIGIPIFRCREPLSLKRLAALVRKGSCLISYLYGYQDSENDICSIEEIRSLWKQGKLCSELQTNTPVHDSVI
ncbi:MAG: IclR family transcriptional regulator [Dehalococcoidia bacterium]|nr:MAG: IclR family transcriptional regulator [Dehalococcoidia bacterium]